MADATLPAVLNFSGGFATDLPDQARDLSYLLEAENVIYEVDGAVHKVGGTEPLYPIVFNGLPSVNGMFDYWRGGGNASFTQNFIIVTASGEIYKDNLDGTVKNITGTAALGADPIPVFCVARDTLTMWFSTNVVPLKYAGSGNVASLGGTPPQGRGAVFHANRMWTWGVNANPSRLYYSSSASIEDWSGIDTGSIDIDVDDGDRIIGVIPFRKVLFVFKGPNKGSIHIISGSSPTGADGFSHEIFNRGIPLQSHNSIVQVGNDVLFMSNRGIHSLSAVQDFGNFTGTEETRFLKKFFREQINPNYLERVWATDYSQKSCVLWTIARAGTTSNNKALGLSYVRHKEEGYKPFTWNRSCVSSAIRKNPNTHLDDLIFGSNTGTCLRQDTATRAESIFSLTGFTLDHDQLDIDSLGGVYSSRAYTMRVRTPQLLLGKVDTKAQPKPDQPIGLEAIYMRSISSGDHNVNLSVTRDNNPPESYVFNQGAPGFKLDLDKLDQGHLGGEHMRLIYSDPPAVGSGRAFQFEITQGGLNQDAHVLEVGVLYRPEGASNEAV